MFCTLWPSPLTFWPNIKGIGKTHDGSPREKFGDCSFSRFGFIMRADRQTDAQTDADERLTPASVVGVSKKQTALTVLKLISFFFNASDWKRLCAFSEGRMLYIESVYRRRSDSSVPTDVDLCGLVRLQSPRTSKWHSITLSEAKQTYIIKSIAKWTTNAYFTRPYFSRA